MKIDYIYNILKKNIKQIDLKSKRISDQTSFQNIHIIEDMQTSLVALREINKLEIFESILDFKKEYPVFWCWSENNYTDNGNETNSIVNHIHAIKRDISTVIKILKNLIPERAGYILSVKLPDYEELNSLPEFYKNLDIVLTPLIKYFSDDKLEIHSFENGSKWNEFLVKNKVTIEVICLILQASMSLYVDVTEIQKNHLDMKMAYESIATDVEDQDFTKKIDAILEKQIDGKYNQYTDTFIHSLETKEITIDNRGNASEEIRTVIKRSFKHSTILISEGTEFYGKLDNEDEELNGLIDQLEASQRLLIHQKEINHLNEVQIKSLKESKKDESEEVKDLKVNKDK